MKKTALTVALASTLMLAGCSDDAEKAEETAASTASGVSSPVSSTGTSSEAKNDLLEFIPADTPYVFANLAALPSDIIGRFWNDDILAPSRTAIERAVGDREWNDTAASKLARAALEALGERMTVAGLDELGYNPTQPFAMYGVGLLPVARIPMTNPGGFDAYIADVERRSGETVATGTIDGQSYRYLDGGDAHVFGAEIDGMLVLGVQPAKAGEDAMRKALGLTRPAESIAKTGALQATIEEHGFLDYFGAEIDIVKIVDAFMTPASAENEALFALMDYDASQISDACRAETKAMALVAPSLVAGYTRADSQAMGITGILELREDLAQSLSGISAGVPGLGGPGEGLFSFGMGFQLLAMKQFAQDQIAAMQADPYSCEWFAEMNASVAQAAQAVNQPLPPFMSTLQGFVAVVDDFSTPSPGQPMPDKASARMLVAMDNPQILLGMGQMMLPELAQLQLSADGEPVPLTLSMVPPGLDDPQVAMTDSAFGLSVGAGQAPKLKTMLGTETPDDGPIMSFGYDLQRFSDIMQDTMSGAGDMSDPDVAAATESFSMLKSIGQRIDIDVTFTSGGARFDETITF